MVTTDYSGNKEYLSVIAVIQSSIYPHFCMMLAEHQNEMVEAIEGLGRVDVRILRFLQRHDSVEDDDFIFNPRVVGSNIDEDNDYVSKRSRRLEAVGIFERPRKGEYYLTDLGRRLCSNNLTEAEIDQIKQALADYDM